jgi:hypothetical protein
MQGPPAESAASTEPAESPSYLQRYPQNHPLTPATGPAYRTKVGELLPGFRPSSATISSLPLAPQLSLLVAGYLPVLFTVVLLPSLSVQASRYSSRVVLLRPGCLLDSLCTILCDVSPRQLRSCLGAFVTLLVRQPNGNGPTATQTLPVAHPGSQSRLDVGIMPPQSEKSQLKRQRVSF